MITTSTKYALSALLYLAKTKGDDFVSIDSLSTETSVPRSYLAKIMKLLAARGLVLSKKGLGGGFKLDSARKKITFLDVCIALDDPISRESCFLGRQSCSEVGGCPFHSRWKAMRASIIKFLSESTIV